jgi:hypothetical protein
MDWPSIMEEPIPGPFGAESTTDEVLEGVDLSGKRILVTGASAGLGVETARARINPFSKPERMFKDSN